MTSEQFFSGLSFFLGCVLVTAGLAILWTPWVLVGVGAVAILAGLGD